MQSISIEDDGLVEINGIAIDIAVAAEHFSRAVRESNGDELAYQNNLHEAIITIGLKPMSHSFNHRVALEIWGRNREIQKKDAAILGLGVEPGSQTTTESTLTS